MKTKLTIGLLFFAGICMAQTDSVFSAFATTTTLSGTVTGTLTRRHILYRDTVVNDPTSPYRDRVLHNFKWDTTVHDTLIVYAHYEYLLQQADEQYIHWCKIVNSRLAKYHRLCDKGNSLGAIALLPDITSAMRRREYFSGIRDMLNDILHYYGDFEFDYGFNKKQ